MAPTILIVEDEVLVGMMLKRKIEKYGYEVCDIATTGREAVTLAETYEPDLLLMDVSLPGDVDGVDAARQIKEFRAIPVIFFTGNHRDEKLISRSEEIQPVAIFDKMGSFEELMSIVKKVLPI